MPEYTKVFPGFDRVGERTRIAADVTVFRFGASGSSLVLGDDCVLYHGTRVVIGDIRQHPDTGVVIGDRVHVNVASYLSGEGGLRIHDDVLIGPHAKILSAGHQIDGGHPIISHESLTFGAIDIGTGAWIGAGAIVLQGVQIGAGAVVAAGAVVTRSVPDFAVVAGVPAKLVRYRKGFAPAVGRQVSTGGRNSWFAGLSRLWHASLKKPAE